MGIQTCVHFLEDCSRLSAPFFCFLFFAREDTCDSQRRIFFLKFIPGDLKKKKMLECELSL